MSSGSLPDSANLYIGTGWIVESQGRTTFSFALDESMPPIGSGVPLEGWNWPADVPYMDADDVRWSESQVTLIGEWDGEVFYFTSLASPAEYNDIVEDVGSTVPGSNSSSCDPEAASRVFLDFTATQMRMQEEGRDPMILYSRVETSGDICGVRVFTIVGSPALDDLITGFGDGRVGVEYLLVPVEAPISD